MGVPSPQLLRMLRSPAPITGGMRGLHWPDIPGSPQEIVIWLADKMTTKNEEALDRAFKRIAKIGWASLERAMMSQACCFYDKRTRKQRREVQFESWDGVYEGRDQSFKRWLQRPLPKIWLGCRYSGIKWPDLNLCH